MADTFSKVFSAELDGIEARPVEVETDLQVGIHAFSIVGLADKALNEAKERVSAALKNIGVKPPSKENRKITVNLAPADFKKTGSHYDLAIAVGYLLATGQIKKFDTTNKLFVGELALDGSLRSVSGALNIAHLASRLNFEYLFVPIANAREAAIIKDVKIIPVKNLMQIIAHLEETEKIIEQPVTAMRSFANAQDDKESIQLSDIKGQDNAKRALLVAAAGGHNILMSGSPGGGKTMLAQALVTLLPPLSLDEIIEVTKIYSAAGLLKGRAYITRPFRSPHHSASPAAIIGGGSNPRPGEISLAHKGVLMMDEFPEFRRDVLETLRQPLESKTITISRVKNNLDLPANFMLTAAMNPCPCGYRGDDKKECRCSANETSRYEKKISGPLLDRIDIQINVPRVELHELRRRNSDKLDPPVKLEDDRTKVVQARNLQIKRQGKLNSELSSKECDSFIILDKSAGQILEKMFAQHLATARGYYRILKIARTIADLDNSEIVTATHLQEAFGYRLREDK